MRTNDRAPMRFLFVFLLFTTFTVNAHSPDLSSVMIYEQNGKLLLLIKGSLTAFEGEIDYHFKKNAYKTPEEFVQFVIKHFSNSCLVIINNDTIKFINPQVQLGHETTLFAELANVRQKIESCYVKNTLFEDTPNHQSELVITAKGLPQMQYILYNGNNHEVKLSVENEKWILDNTGNSFFAKSTLILPILLFSMILLVAVVIKYRRGKFATSS
jgi:hypothetical protein